MRGLQGMGDCLLPYQPEASAHLFVPSACTPCGLQGMGDCLLTYENEAFFTNLVVPEKDRLPYIVPDNNIRVRC